MGVRGTTECSIDECEKRVFARGWCSTHYTRWSRLGSPTAEVRYRHPSWAGQQCGVRECEKPVHAHGLCPTHWRRKKLYGNPDGTFETHKKCVDCDEPAIASPRSSDYCREHFQWYIRRLAVEGKLKTHRGSGGYQYHSVLKRSIGVHVMVMEHHIGRFLLPGETPHHKNGDRADNRIENLELWSSHQPAGQRVADKLAFAREIIARYENVPAEVL